MTFSKRLLIIDYIIAIALVVVAVVYAFVSDTYSNPLTTMSDVWIGQAAVVSAFYLWKSKCENRAKYAQEWYEKMLKDPDISPEKMSAVASVVDTITRE